MCIADVVHPCRHLSQHALQALQLTPPLVCCFRGDPDDRLLLEAVLPLLQVRHLPACTLLICTDRRVLAAYKAHVIRFLTFACQLV